MAAWYTVQFFLHYVRFARLEREAGHGDEAAVERFNAALRGFPASGFAKMLGKRRLER